MRSRLLVDPGVTGLRQVSGRSDLSWGEGVGPDLSYVENRSCPVICSLVYADLLEQYSPEAGKAYFDSCSVLFAG